MPLPSPKSPGGSMPRGTGILNFLIGVKGWELPRLPTDWTRHFRFLTLAPLVVSWRFVLDMHKD